MLHAFSWLPLLYRWVLLGILVAGSLAFVVALAIQGKPLKTSAAPLGIVSLELAWSKSRAEEILNTWISLIGTARRQLRIDFGFLVFYPLAISLGCAVLAESRLNSMAAAGLIISWVSLAAGPLDAAENLALLDMLRRGATGTAARAASCCAGLKFALVLAGLGYLLLQGVLILLRKLNNA